VSPHTPWDERELQKTQWPTLTGWVGIVWTMQNSLIYILTYVISMMNPVHRPLITSNRCFFSRITR
jgi:hypothetical protein